MGLTRAGCRILFGCCPQSERGGRRPTLPITFYVPALSGLPRFIAQTLRAPQTAQAIEDERLRECPAPGPPQADCRPL